MLNHCEVLLLRNFWVILSKVLRLHLCYLVLFFFSYHFVDYSQYILLWFWVKQANTAFKLAFRDGKHEMRLLPLSFNQHLSYNIFDQREVFNQGNIKSKGPVYCEFEQNQTEPKDTYISTMYVKNKQAASLPTRTSNILQPIHLSKWHHCTSKYRIKTFTNESW